MNLKFEAAFKYQLKLAKPLTESAVDHLANRKCGISNKPFKVGESILFVMIPTRTEGVDYELVAAKASELKKRRWKYYPVEGAQIPRVVVNE